MKQWAGLLVMIATLALAVAIVIWNPAAYFQTNLATWGYVGAFFIMFICSATIILPVPGWIGLFVLARYMDPLWLGVVGGFGSALGEITSYVFGRGGKMMIEERHIEVYERTKAWLHKNGLLVIFLFAALPLPVDIVGIAAGATGYPMWKFMAAMIPGKIIKTWIVTFSGSLTVGLF